MMQKKELLPSFSTSRNISMREEHALSEDKHSLNQPKLALIVSVALHVAVGVALIFLSKPPVPPAPQSHFKAVMLLPPKATAEVAPSVIKPEPIVKAIVKPIVKPIVTKKPDLAVVPAVKPKPVATKPDLIKAPVVMEAPKPTKPSKEMTAPVIKSITDKPIVKPIVNTKPTTVAQRVTTPVTPVKTPITANTPVKLAPQQLKKQVLAQEKISADKIKLDTKPKPIDKPAPKTAKTDTATSTHASTNALKKPVEVADKLTSSKDKPKKETSADVKPEPKKVAPEQTNKKDVKAPVQREKQHLRDPLESNTQDTEQQLVNSISNNKKTLVLNKTPPPDDAEFETLKSELKQADSSSKNTQKSEPKSSSAQTTDTSAPKRLNQKLLDQYRQKIIQRIYAKWVAPSVPESTQCELRITLAPNGEILSIIRVKSSGIEAFDDSAVQAVDRSSPLPVPDDPTVFNRMRVINLKLTPEQD